jgi:hypothetical protein
VTAHPDQSIRGSQPLLGCTDRPFPLVQAPFSSIETLDTRRRFHLNAEHVPVIPVPTDRGPKSVRDERQHGFIGPVG